MESFNVKMMSVLTEMGAYRKQLQENEMKLDLRLHLCFEVPQPVEMERAWLGTWIME